MVLPSPPSWGRAGEGGRYRRSKASIWMARGFPPSLTLPHEGGGDPREDIGVRNGQRDRARRLRRDRTPAERKLWHVLTVHRFHGLHVRRQAPVGRYIVDFVCHEARLVIEVDGAQHGFEVRSAADAARDTWLEQQGYRVLRFWNGQVLNEFDSVLDTILAAVAHRHPSSVSRLTEGGSGGAVS